MEDLRATADTLEKEIQRLKQLQDNAYNIINGEMRYPRDIGFNKVDRHFRELDKLERESHERAKAEQKAAAEARKGVVQVVIPPKA